MTSHQFRSDISKIEGVNTKNGYWERLNQDKDRDMHIEREREKERERERNYNICNIDAIMPGCWSNGGIQQSLEHEYSNT